MNPLNTGITLRRIDAGEAHVLVDALAEILIDCVAGGASVSFMAPLSPATASAFWRNVADGVGRRERALLVAQEADGRLVGTVQLILQQPENQPHRADVAKMLVRRDARRRGIAMQLLQAVEQLALQEGKTVLLLDTVTGGDGDRLYARGGWQRAGDVPKYALMPDGAFASTTFYYKHL